ncbi:hypothetical protein F751_2538 [Auxenochlorella protothecoides]|uniref:Uncharacterized protein n=1 Tax=Auxenochlorella protothecoides TaxID=3075 RepID=A0A087SIZ2_AUXPR|nr:hypothetical protein F751_2538 [Auxenochlorella protothecoides]KFM25696.1 hypothetical protein F751_2538 [Auxenochlorella protothecoides]
MDAVRMSTAELVTPRSTKVIVAVECLKPGQTACTADSSGNIGSGNRGKRNFGTNNVGDDNIGSSNWGDNNKGTSNRCFDKVGDRKVVNDCKLTEFLLPSPTGTMTWNGLKFNYAIDTGSYIASSLTLVTFASDNTVLGTYAAKPTSTVTERTATALPVVAKLFAYAKGFSKAGSVRTSTLNILGLSMDAVRMSTAELVTPRSTKVIVAVECLKPGQTACTADSSGNIGSGNRGKRNFGTNNVGDDNIGEWGGSDADILC